MSKITNADAADSGFADEQYSREELAAALRLRQQVQPAPGQRRKDLCPHADICPDLKTCVRYIAWYLRHQRAIEHLDEAIAS